MLQFCDMCDNMVNLQATSENELTTVCVQCGYDKPVSTTDETMSVFRKSYSKTKINPSLLINKYTHLDPTLPRLKNKACVNSECPTLTQTLLKVEGKTESEFRALYNMKEYETFQIVQKMNSKEWVFSSKEEEKQKWLQQDGVSQYTGEIVFLKYDEKNMKYVYVCTTCSHAWTNE